MQITTQYEIKNKTYEYKNVLTLFLTNFTMSFFKYLITHYKSTLFSLLNAISVYALSKGYISMDEATLISAVILALGGTVNIALPRK